MELKDVMIFLPPLTIAIAGGVIGAILLALSLTQATYLIVVRRNQKFRYKAIARKANSIV